MSGGWRGVVPTLILTLSFNSCPLPHLPSPLPLAPSPPPPLLPLLHTIPHPSTPPPLTPLTNLSQEEEAKHELALRLSQLELAISTSPTLSPASPFEPIGSGASTTTHTATNHTATNHTASASAPAVAQSPAQSWVAGPMQSPQRPTAKPSTTTTTTGTTGTIGPTTTTGVSGSTTTPTGTTTGTTAANDHDRRGRVGVFADRQDASPDNQFLAGLSTLVGAQLSADEATALLAQLNSTSTGGGDDLTTDEALALLAQADAQADAHATPDASSPTTYPRSYVGGQGWVGGGGGLTTDRNGRDYEFITIATRENLSPLPPSSSAQPQPLLLSRAGTTSPPPLANRPLPGTPSC